MIDPNKFLALSDYDAVGNVSDVVASVAASGTVAAGAEVEFKTTVTVDTDHPSTQAYCGPSTEPGKNYLVNNAIYLTRSAGAAYQAYPFVHATSRRSLTIGVRIPNPYGATLNLVSETYTFNVKLFQPPFAALEETGTAATGTLRLENRETTTIIIIPVETVFTISGGPAFYLTSSVSVPGASVVGGTVVPGVATGPAACLANGTAGNIADGTSLNIQGERGEVFSPNHWRAIAVGAFTGGT